MSTDIRAFIEFRHPTASDWYVWCRDVFLTQDYFLYRRLGCTTRGLEYEVGLALRPLPEDSCIHDSWADAWKGPLGEVGWCSFEEFAAIVDKRPQVGSHWRVLVDVLWCLTREYGAGNVRLVYGFRG